MTVSTEHIPLSFNGDGSTVNFAITWKYFAKSHVVATLRSAAGVETVWALTTNYTLTAAGVEAGGTLTAVVAPATGEKLVITLEPPNTQDASLPLGGAFPSPSVEDGLDLSAQRDSKFKNLLNRTFRVPVTDTQSGSNLEFPIDSSRASKYLSFDVNGKPIAVAGTTNTPTVSSFMETVLDDASAAAARTTLGLGTAAVANLATMSAITLSAAALNEALSTVASATTPDIWAAGVANVIDYTGTATATGFAAAPQAGLRRTLVLAAAAVFTAGANMLIDGVASGSNFTGAAGDKVHVIAVTTTQFRLTPAKADGTAVAGGKIRQLVAATKTDTFGLASATFTAITGLTVTTAALVSTGSKVRITVTVGRAGINNAVGSVIAFRLMRDSTPIGVGDVAGSRIQNSFAVDVGRDLISPGGGFAFTWYDSPGAASAFTYSLQMSTAGGAQGYINRNYNDPDDTLVSSGRSVSSIIAEEISS